MTPLRRSVLLLAVLALPSLTQAQPDKLRDVAKGALVKGERNEQRLSPAEAHAWTLTLEAGHYTELRVEQLEVDVVISVSDPDSVLTGQFDGTYVPDEETPRWIARRAGTWHVRIASFDPNAQGGYALTWAVDRPATEQDRLLIWADSLQMAALGHFGSGRYQEALLLLEQVLDARKQLHGSESPEVASSLNYLAQVNKTLGLYDAAEPLYGRALDLMQHLFGPDHPEVATGLGTLGSLYYEQGRYSEAEPLFRAALDLQQRVLGPGHPNVAISQNSLARLYTEQGRYDEAEPLYRRALDILEQSVDPNHPEVFYVLNDLANLFETQGRLDEAELLFVRTRALGERLLGPDHPAVATLLNNLATVYSDQGRFDESERLYRRALAILEGTFGPAHTEVAAGLNNLALVLHDQGRLDEAEALFVRALEIDEQALGPDHPYVAGNLTNLARLYMDTGRLAEAEPLLTRAIGNLEESLGPDHPRVARVLNSLSRLYDRMGRMEEAFPLVDRSVRILDAVSGDAVTRIIAYDHRAQLHKKAGRPEEALADLDEALRTAEDLRPQSGGGEETRAAVFQRYGDAFDRMVAWQIEAGELEAAFDYAERGRARVFLDQLAAGRVDLRAAIPPDVRGELESRERTARVQLAEFTQRVTLMRTRTDLSHVDRFRRLGALQDSLRRAEQAYHQVYQDIKNASPLWRDLLTSGGRPVDLRDVQQRIVQEGQLMVVYQIGPEQSFLFVVPPRGRPLEVFTLEVGEAQAAALQMELGALGWQGALGLERLHTLFAMLVPPTLWPTLAEAEEVILIPDGALHVLPFEALVVEPPADPQTARFWLDVGPPIRYAPSASVLYNLDRRPPTRPVPSGLSVLSLSDPIYDPAQLDSTEASAQVRPDPVVSTAPTRASYERLGGSLARLPGTAKETEAVLNAFGKEAGQRVEVLQGRDAVEPNVRQALPGKRYVHLATHGLVDARSSALFASLALTPPPGETSDLSNDGFLQLHEIHELDLSETELTVLSACDTGVGPLVEGEGVFALSRGFLAAGARRVVASHWSVDDESTAALMGAFFEAVVEAERAGLPVAYTQALTEAKRRIRNEPGWSAPYYWAPFVLSGGR